MVPHINQKFFFQAEDGIRAVAVTGVQTCALPISGTSTGSCRNPIESDGKDLDVDVDPDVVLRDSKHSHSKIGRASCRERVWIGVAVVSLPGHATSVPGVGEDPGWRGRYRRTSWSRI